jgi:hypothetical protein
LFATLWQRGRIAKFHFGEPVLDGEVRAERFGGLPIEDVLTSDEKKQMETGTEMTALTTNAPKPLVSAVSPIGRWTKGSMIMSRELEGEYQYRLPLA